MKAITNKNLVILFIMVFVSFPTLTGDMVRAEERELSKAVFYVQ